ncbi:hypothetical protein BH23ACI1_BH23ACI1_26940 [soil metagenome]
MRKALIIMGLLSVLGFGASTAAQKEPPASGKVATLKVSGMSCGVCAARVEKAAKQIDGVKAAKVDQPKGIAEITYDPDKTSPAAIAKEISKKTPFKAEGPSPEKK